MSAALPQPVLIDTDIGDDVDDAFALALAARLPELRICGVTTVAGPVQRRAWLAQGVLAAAGQADVPVVAGSSVMSDGRAGSERFSHQVVLGAEIGGTGAGGATLALPNSTSAASEFILHAARVCAPLTIIALGPLTNVAIALARDPALAQRAQLVAMAGKLGFPYPDWNVRCDPVAARRVLASGMSITLVGMQVTMRCKLLPSQARALFSSYHPLLATLARCVLAWRTWKRRMPILHDALTVAVAANPSLVSLEPQRVRVLAGGFSLSSRRGSPNALVCTSVDIVRFHALLNTGLFGAAVPTSEPHDLLAKLTQALA